MQDLQGVASLGSYRFLFNRSIVIKGGSHPFAFCRWVDTQLKPHRRGVSGCTQGRSLWHIDKFALLAHL
jgi:hypothetical protein